MRVFIVIHAGNTVYKLKYMSKLRKRTPPKNACIDAGQLREQGKCKYRACIMTKVTKTGFYQVTWNLVNIELSAYEVSVADKDSLSSRRGQKP